MGQGAPLNLSTSGASEPLDLWCIVRFHLQELRLQHFVLLGDLLETIAELLSYVGWHAWSIDSQEQPLTFGVALREALDRFLCLGQMVRRLLRLS